MQFITLPLYGAEVDTKSVRVNPRLIAYYRKNHDGTMLRMLTGKNIYTSLSVAEVDVKVDHAL